MAEYIIPPSPSWYLSSILGCSDDGKTVAYGARHEIVIVKLSKNENNHYDTSSSFITMAHQDRVTAVAFPPSSAENYTDNIVSLSDDGSVHVWNYSAQQLRFCHNGHPEGHKLPSLDWSRADPNLIVSVSDLGSIVCWDLISNTIKRLCAGDKILPVCVKCSPHNKNIIAIGAKQGLIVIYNIKGNGEQVFRLRGHETDVVSLAFCPKPNNVFRPESSENVNLLVSGSKDRCIYFWKTGTDGRLEYSINLPLAAMSGQRNKNGTLAGASSSWVSVCWPMEHTLFAGSLYGELLAYDLKPLIIPPKGTNVVKKKPKPILVHGIHFKGLFSIAASVPEYGPPGVLIWSSALDKHLICVRYKDLKILANITTVGGIVYCMASSPLDPYRIAIGTGDNKVSVWNMSSHQSEDVQTYWNKINSKVMALAWHPTQENLLAFGTGEGRIGLLDLCGKQAILLRLYHRKCVYSLIWAPPVIIPEGDDIKLALFTVGDGEIVQYNTEVSDKEPESLQKLLKACDATASVSKTLIRTDLAFNHDKSFAAIGNENGSIYIVGGQKFNHIHTIFAHKKLVQCLTWHPLTVTSESSPSIYASWLASASDNIRVVSVTDSNVEVIRTLGDHCEKVVSLQWSPHINGRLITASYDYTSQVWDIIKGTLISWIEGHHGAVVCCMFSPAHPDMVLTGSADCTIRLWDISKHSDLSTTVSAKNKKQRIVGAKLKFEGAQYATDLNAEDGSEYQLVKTTAIKISSGEKKEKMDEEKVIIKRRQASMFPATSGSLVSAKHIDILWEKILAKEALINKDCKENGIVENETDKKIEVNGCEKNGPASPSASIADSCYLDYFGDEKDIKRLLTVEETQHIANGNFQNATHTSLWNGGISESIHEAIKKKQLNEWLISLAPLVSYSLWNECCVKYANQLMENHSSEGQGMKAASYFLAVHKIEEAVDCLISCKLPKEAAVLAKSRLMPDDPVVEKAMRAWAHQCLHRGQMILAAHCFLSIGDKMGCVDALSHSKDATTLSVASSIANSLDSKNLALTIALRSVVLSLSTQEYEVANLTLQNHPKLKELKLWVDICALLSTEIRLNDDIGSQWLLGKGCEGKFSLLDICIEKAKPLSPMCYQTLYKNIPSVPEYTTENSIWMYIGGQISMAVISFMDNKPDVGFNHIAKALNAAYCYQNYHRLSNRVFLQIAPFLFPNGPCEYDKSIVKTVMARVDLTKPCDTIEDTTFQKIEAHLIACGIYWIEYLLSQEHSVMSPPTESFKRIFINSTSVLLKKDLLTYYSNEIKIKSLEKQVSLLKLESRKIKDKSGESEKHNESVESTTEPTDSPTKETASNCASLEASLDELKTWKSKFEAAHCPTVNPFVIYCCIKDVLQQISSKDEKHNYQQIFKDVVAKWEELNQ